MNVNTNMAGAMMNAGTWFGVGGGVAALAAIPNAEASLVTCAVMFAVAAGSTMRKYLFAAPAVMKPADYPFETTANPWERDGGPLGL